MTFLIAGNWKMNGTRTSARDLSAALAAKALTDIKAEVVLCPPAALLGEVASVIGAGPVQLGAQDCHTNEKGAHTGDTSAWLLRDIGCTYVIVGHSERRADHGETDAVVKAKAAAALKAGLKPIICVGETAAQRESGETQAVIARQVRDSIPEGATADNCVVAYEPVWAIGTGKVATTADIAVVHFQIRDVVKVAHGGIKSDRLRILYGGSVKGSNAAGILATAGVDGALVGGASLDAADFWQIIEACP